MGKHPGAGWMQPWRNPLGEALATILARLGPLRREDREDDWEAEDHHHPDTAWSGLRFCKVCNTGTLHLEHWWRVEDETTIECTVCDGIWVIE